MDRHPQQIKRTRQDTVRRERNHIYLTRMRTLVKNVYQTQDPEEAQKAYSAATAYVDKMTSKHLLHKNKAARRKAQMAQHVNSLST